MDIQLYVGHREISEITHPRSISNIGMGRSNKPDGGLWTSTFDHRYGSGWVQFCYAEKYCIPDDGIWMSTLVYPKRNARVYEIDTLADLAILVRRFPSDNGDYHFKTVDYEGASERYDAIHLTERGQWNTRMTAPNLYGWDCESTLWLNPAFDHITVLGEVHFMNRRHD